MAPVIDVYIDRRKHRVVDSINLLQACLSLGFDIPYFCWHPELGSVGACRQCVVKRHRTRTDSQGTLVMSCMTPVSSGLVVTTCDEEVARFRRSVVELLMTHHPHDCPVCEEGGHCHLQDMTVMCGHFARRYRFPKRVHRNQNLGPFLSHEMNRCINCYRCVRFYRDYADGEDLGVYGLGRNLYFGRFREGTLRNEFSGNLAEVCPTGVFTDKTHSQHYARKWDTRFAPSVCPHCSVGCNVSLGERYGKLCRVENRYHASINHHFLCDRGRFGYGYVNLSDRPKRPVHRTRHGCASLSFRQAVRCGADLLRNARSIVGVGSPRASLESNFALQNLVGIDNFYSGVSDEEFERMETMRKILRAGVFRLASLREVESYDAVLVLGEDVTQTGARLALSIRQAAKRKAQHAAQRRGVRAWQSSSVETIGGHERYPVFVTGIDRTRLDDIAVWTHRASPQKQAQLGFCIASALHERAPKCRVDDAAVARKVELAARALRGAQRPLIVSGSGAGDKDIIASAANVALALKKLKKKVGISLVSADVNSVGLSCLRGKKLSQGLQKMRSRSSGGCVVLENDLCRCLSRTQFVETRSTRFVVLDHQTTESGRHADLLLPSSSPAEGNGTMINQEGRAQRYFQVYDPNFYDPTSVVVDSWRWLYALKSCVSRGRIDWVRLDDVHADLTERYPELSGVRQAAPDASFRVHGQKMARCPHRFSGRTVMHSDHGAHESSSKRDADTMFTFSMEGHNSFASGRQPTPFAWLPGWNSSQAWNKRSNAHGSTREDSGIRLFARSSNRLSWFDAVDPRTVPRTKWRIVPYSHLFGSEELSQRSPAVRQRMPTPCATVGREDASEQNWRPGTRVSFVCLGECFVLPVRISSVLCRRHLGLPAGLPGIPAGLFGREVSVRTVRSRCTARLQP